jgi:hypothetical protein
MILIKKFFRYILIFSSLLLISSLIFKKDQTFRVLDQILPQTLTGLIRFFTEITISPKKINNDYNVKFLPKTQFAVLDFYKNKLSFVLRDDVGYLNVLRKKPFVFDIYDDYVIVVPTNGTFYYQDINATIINKKNFKEIASNLDTINVLDIFIDNQDIYVSYVKKTNDCSFLYLSKSIIDLVKLNFEDIFKSNECVSNIQSGRIQKTKYNNNSFILLATAGDVLSGGRDGKLDSKPQDNKSIYGKIISINQENYNYSIFSKGHRNILGLSSIDNVILSTENGPRGGDEINRIYKDKNYGWPIASDGNKYVKGYGYSDGDDVSLSQRDYSDHLDMNFEPPIFSFIPSMGISEIIKIDNNFARTWQNNYLVGSLHGNHIYRVRFNKEFNKINYFEKIFIGERIRDLKYIPSHSIILMALEGTGSIGILKNKN